MPAITGSFSGKVRVQTAISVPDQLNHELNLAEIAGTQKSPDEKWNNAAITYWGITDLVEGKGTRQAYLVNFNGEVDGAWGTSRGGAARPGGRTRVEGPWQS